MRLEAPTVSLGDGVELRQTYAHLMSPFVMAFTRPGPGEHHPAPWKTAQGGFAFDIEVELKMQSGGPLAGGFDRETQCWMIAALLRLARAPYLSLVVFSDQPFSEVGDGETEPVLRPFEVEPRFLVPPSDDARVLRAEELAWIRKVWVRTGRMLEEDSRLETALRAFDSATVHGRNASSLLMLWGAIEQLFSPSPGELRFRVSSQLASFLEPPGRKRFDLYKRLLKLYNERSKAAHTAQDIEHGPLMETYVVARNALVKIVDEGKVPSQDELSRLLFCVPDHSDDANGG